jgi:hypothetical protein
MTLYIAIMVSDSMGLEFKIKSYSCGHFVKILSRLFCDSGILLIIGDDQLDPRGSYHIESS